MNYAHTAAHIDQALRVCAEVFKEMREAAPLTVARLAGALTEELW